LTAFRASRIVLWGIIAGYAAIVVATHGPGLLNCLLRRRFPVRVRRRPEHPDQGDMTELILGKARADA
jgi:hypothetical protein